MKIILISFVVIAFNLKARECDLDHLTNKCAVFASGQENLNYPDGSISFVGPLGFLSADDRDSFRELDKYGLKVSDVINNISSSQMSETAREWMLSSEGITFFSALLRAQQKINAVILVKIPWPLDREPSTMREVSATEASSIMQNLLGFENVRTLTQVASEANELASRRTVLSFARAESDLKNRAASRQMRADQIIFRARDALIENFLSGRTESQLSDSELSLLTRLRKIEIIAGPQSDCNSIMSAGGHYDPSSHSIVICEGAYNLPDEEIFMITAHEISHAIDPCTTSGPLVQIDVAQFREEIHFSNDKKGNDDEEMMSLRALTTSRGYAQISPSDFNRPKFQSLMQKGIMSVVAPAISQTTNPFRNVLNCLATPNGGGFPDANWRKVLQDQTVLRCSPDPLYEAFSDWNASRTLGRELLNADSILNKLPGAVPLVQRPPLRSVGTLAGLACVSDSNDPTPEDRLNLSAQEWMGRSHPPAQMRVERVIFRDPDLRRAFQCSISQEQACTLETNAVPSASGIPPRRREPKAIPISSGKYSSTSKSNKKSDFIYSEVLKIKFGKDENEGYDLKKVKSFGKSYHLLSYSTNGAERARVFLTPHAYKNRRNELLGLKKVVAKKQKQVDCGYSITVEEKQEKEKIHLCHHQISDKENKIFNEVIESFKTALRR